jgi:hypothetical protein
MPLAPRRRPSRHGLGCAMNSITATGQHGRRFVWVGLIPWQRADGHGTYVAQWQGTCATCGKPFEVLTPAAVLTDGKSSSSLSLANCPKHRRVRQARAAA